MLPVALLPFHNVRTAHHPNDHSTPYRRRLFTPKCDFRGAPNSGCRSIASMNNFGRFELDRYLSIYRFEFLPLAIHARHFGDSFDIHVLPLLLYRSTRGPFEL